MCVYKGVYVSVQSFLLKHHYSYRCRPIPYAVYNARGIKAKYVSKLYTYQYVYV